MVEQIKRRGTKKAIERIERLVRKYMASMMLKDKRASQLSIRGCSSWAGPMAATCGSTTVGLRAMLIAIVPRHRVEPDL
jgi:hypothetical protein